MKPGDYIEVQCKENGCVNLFNTKVLSVSKSGIPSHIRYCPNCRKSYGKYMGEHHWRVRQLKAITEETSTQSGFEKKLHEGFELMGYEE